jgi:hypothetical protein
MLVVGKGKRAFVPPEDPRHPGPATAPPRTSASTNVSTGTGAGTSAGTSADAGTGPGGSGDKGAGPGRGATGHAPGDNCATDRTARDTTRGTPITADEPNAARGRPRRPRRTRGTELRLDIDNCHDDVARSEHGP